MAAYLPYLGYENSVQAGTPHFTVSAYTGMSVNEAKKALSSEKINVRIIGDGDKVISQMPQAGSEISQTEGTVILYTEHGEKEEVTVPSFLDMKPADVNRLIAQTGLKLKVCGVSGLGSGTGAVVALQSIAAGTRVSKGTVIELTFLYTDDTD